MTGNDRPAVRAGEGTSLPEKTGLTRREVLKTSAIGALAATAGAAAAGGPSAQAGGALAAPAFNQGNVAGLKFKALVRWGTGTQIINVRLRELQPTQVLVRTLACCGCYTIVPTILGTNNVQTPTVPNHSTMGMVEAVGPLVRRVRVGDRVLVSGTPECGTCYQCLHGEPSRCNYLGLNNNTPFADTFGVGQPTPVLQQSGVGGVAEYSVAWEEYCIPIFSELSHAEVAMLGDTFAAGYLATRVYRPLTGGEDVVIFGAGPVGLGAIQGARAGGAGQVIVIEPVDYRQDAARASGATTVLDPNAFPIEGNRDTLVEAVRGMCNGPTDRVEAGGRRQTLTGNFVGGDLVVDASGFEQRPPKVVSGPDPTGIRPLIQAYNVTAYGGHFVPLAVQQGNFSVPGSTFSLKSMHTHGGQMAGVHAMRDTPRMVKMAERGFVDIGSVITMRVPLERAVEGWQAVADRTTLGMVVEFPE
jgi:S-(hydroxymethyl)glutathione dehydrogenase/alcohol dehydrogenase